MTLLEQLLEERGGQLAFADRALKVMSGTSYLTLFWDGGECDERLHCSAVDALLAAQIQKTTREVREEYEKIECPSCEGYGYTNEGSACGRVECEPCNGHGTILRRKNMHPDPKRERE